MTKINLIAAVKTLEESPYDNYYFGRDGNNKIFGIAFNDVKNILGENESVKYFESLSSFEEYYKNIFDEEDQNEKEMIDKEILKAEKVGFPLWMYSNTTLEEDIYTEDINQTACDNYIEIIMGADLKTKDECIGIINKDIEKFNQDNFKISYEVENLIKYLSSDWSFKTDYENFLNEDEEDEDYDS